MEAVYRKQDGKRIVLFDEGNQLLAAVIDKGKHVQLGQLCKDYFSDATSFMFEDEIYVAYLNIENVLYLDHLFQAGRLALISGEKLGDISDARIVVMTSERKDICVFYRRQNFAAGTNSICVMNPFGERKNQELMVSEQRIEYYQILSNNGVTYLLYKMEEDRRPRIFAVDINRLGDISLSEYILCKEKTIKELSKRCKDNDKEFQIELRKKQDEYEKRLKDTTKNMEKKYKAQYKELSELAKGLQVEGRKWREMYYKSVTKN